MSSPFASIFFASSRVKVSLATMGVAIAALLPLVASGKSHVKLTAITAPAGGNTVHPLYLSAEGNAVVGVFTTAAGNTHAFRWTTALGSRDLGTLGGSVSEPYGLSDNGSVVSGVAATAGSESLNRAFRWTVLGMRDLGTLGGNISGVAVRGVSAAGTVIVGSADTAFSTHAVRWKNGIIQDLHPADSFSSTAEAVSGDGNVIAGSKVLFTGGIHLFRVVGNVTTDLGSHGDWSFVRGMSRNGAALHGEGSGGAFRWSADRGFEDIGGLGGGFSSVVGISANGNVLTGTAFVDPTNIGRQHAYIWQAGATTDLGTLGGSYSAATAISPGGDIVIGGSVTADEEQRPFVWTRQTGMLDLAALIGQSGVDVRHWHFGVAVGIAVDGDDLTILGFGTRNGLPAGWVLTVSNHR